MKSNFFVLVLIRNWKTQFFRDLQNGAHLFYISVFYARNRHQGTFQRFKGKSIKIIQLFVCSLRIEMLSALLGGGDIILIYFTLVDLYFQMIGLHIYIAWIDFFSVDFRQLNNFQFGTSRNESFRLLFWNKMQIPTLKRISEQLSILIKRLQRKMLKRTRVCCVYRESMNKCSCLFDNCVWISVL